MGSGLSYQHMWPRDYIQDLQQNLALRCALAEDTNMFVYHVTNVHALCSNFAKCWRLCSVSI